MNETPHTSPFDAVRRIDENGNEYWSARELYRQLGYSRWDKFQKSLTEAQEACKNSGQVVEDHFHLQVKMVGIGSKARRPTEDLPTPAESIQELERKEQKRLKQSQQPSLLDEQQQ